MHRRFDLLYEKSEFNLIVESWYLIYAKPRDENLAKEHLERQKYEVYLPLIVGKSKQKRRNVKTVQPMFPRYLFIYLSDRTDDWGPIRSTIGVSNLVRFGVNPARVPSKLIDDLRKNENNDGYHDYPEKGLNLGDNVLITDGPFEGYDATLFSQHSGERVVVLLKISQDHLKLTLDRSLIEKYS